MKTIRLVLFFLAIFSSALYSGVNLSDGLVAHYEFEGNAKDSSGHGNDGVEHGGVGYSDGVIGQASNFDGINDYTSIPKSAISSNVVTISMWEKLTKTDNINRLYNHDGTGSTWYDFESIHFYFGIDKNFNPYLHADSNNHNEGVSGAWANSGKIIINKNKTYSVNDLVHFVVESDFRTYIKLWVDDVYIGKSTIVEDIISSDNQFFDLGRNYLYAFVPEYSTNYYTKIIDDLRIYNRALNKAEIAELYKMGQQKEEVNLKDGLVAHYEFEGNAKDSSGNGNDGLEQGGVKYSDGIIGQASYFDGVDDYIRVKHNDILNLEKMTLSAWVYDYEHINSSAILLKGRFNESGEQKREYSFSSAYRDLPAFGILNSNQSWEDVVGKNKILLKKWTNILVTYNGSSQRVYVNGKLENSRNAIFNNFMPKNPYDLTIGAGFTTKTTLVQQKNGLIDDLRIYNRALNEAEIAEIYKMKDSTTAKKTIKGTVKDNNGKSVSGINVKFEYLVNGKEKSATAISNGSGSYTIKLDKSAFSDKGVNYLIYAYKKGYHPTTKNIKIGSKDSYSIDFVINKIKVNEVVLEIEPKVHHLGDDVYSGSYNSQFQKNTEGLSFSKTFTISRSQYDNYEKATVHFEAKGLEDNYNRLRVNGKVYKLKYAPSDGSYGTFSIKIEKNVYKKGSNSLKISSEDNDDFEFSNIVLEFSGTVENDKDSDGDGISDKDEIRLGLNPNSKDSDGDGILDGDEIGDINNPKDSDEDGVIDALDSDKDEECTEEEDSDGEIKDCDKEGDTEEEKYVNYDFNGDGVADILWKKGDGFSLWYMSENGKHKYKFIGKKKGYTIAGVADFNNDGIADILWKKGGGNYLWYMKADGKHKYKNIGSKTGYKVSGVADFNGDGLADILWTKNGRNYIWYMDEDGKHSYKSIGKKRGYSVAGVADFNNDGIADILWKKGGGNYLWYMKVDGKHKYKNIGRKTGYTVEGVADFNEDGIADIFWKRGSGNYLWYMKIDGKHKYKNMGRKTGYSVKMVADFDGDGVTDVLWKKGSGNYLWYMETNGKHRYKNIGRKSTSYSIQF